ncbi:MAG: radical SAM protein [Candidatus Thermoplasmatota archaeon]|jgi:uncharacterized Fe-S cluster-containing radical SAM superfamily protein|nr:radical SAM protein [Candidatus Thermoplasmatota archaeon]
MYNPLDLSKKTENMVVKGKDKKYYRFRATGFYGGIATADTVGCNLRCKFCWSGNSVWNTEKTGNFYSPEQVAKKLLEIAEHRKFTQVRVSGGEPTIGRDHLLSLLRNIPKKLIFILETNGILLGEDKTYVEDLSNFKNIHVRVCLKGCDEQEFSWFTGADKKGFEYQIRSLENLRDEEISFNIALVSTRKDRQLLFQKLKDMGLGEIMVEEEEITLYPQVRQRLEKEGMLVYFEWA